MSIGHLGFTAHPAAGRRNQKLLAVGVPVLLGIMLVCFAAYFTLRNSRVEVPPQPAEGFLAELVSANGMVLVQNPGRSEWREVKVGAVLREGDRVRTESSGEAGIRYKSGTSVSIPENTVFTVRSLGENRIEISVPPEVAGMPPLLLAADGDSVSSGPKVELQQIIAFGRSLELIGRVEAGNSLSINNEIVEVTGDGSFKHFTKPFPESAHAVKLVLTVKDLAGRVRLWTTTHAFLTAGAENEHD
jgi:hypothetical protein